MSGQWEQANNTDNWNHTVKKTEREKNHHFGFRAFSNSGPKLWNV